MKKLSIMMRPAPVRTACPIHCVSRTAGASCFHGQSAVLHDGPVNLSARSQFAARASRPARVDRSGRSAPGLCGQCRRGFVGRPARRISGGLPASPVYRLLGKTGIETGEMPPIEQPLMNTVGYHIRRGSHDITLYDWNRYMDFAVLHPGEGEQR